MTDLADAAQEITESSVARAEQNARRMVSRPGLAECEECLEPISEYRQRIGARLCIYHQEAKERNVQL